MHLIQDLQPKLQKTGECLRHFLVSKTPQIKTLLKDIALAGLLLWLVLSYLENASQGSVSDYLDPSLPFYFSAISFSAIIFLQKLSPFPQKKQTRQKPGKAQSAKTPQNNFLSRIFPGLTQKKKFLLLKDIFIASLLLNLAILYLEWASSGSAESLLTSAGITAFQFISAASLFLLAFLKQKENLRKASSKTGTIIDKSIDFIAAKLAKLLQTEYLFLASLALLAIINTLKTFEIKTALTQSDLSEKTVFLASFIAIATGAALIIKNRDKIDLDKEKEEEEKQEQARLQEFPAKFPKINKIPVLRNLMRWGYKEGFAFALGLILILSIFAGIKIPYLDNTFTGGHEMKYSALVEPAKYMADNNNPLLNQKKYRALPLINPEGTYNSFGKYPLMEWGLFSVFKIFPQIPIEISTRLFTSFLGLIFLSSIYILLKKFINKKISLLVIFLLSANPIIQFFTHITVMDILMMIFFIFSLITLESGISKNRINMIFLAGVLGGIGANLKYNLLIISFPIYLIIILTWQNRKIGTKVNYCLYLFPFLILETIFFRMSVRWLPQNYILYGSIFLAILVLHIIFFKYSHKLSNLTEQLFDKFLTWKRFLFISLLSVGLAAFILLKKLRYTAKMTDNFLTDRYLIFNWPMYQTFLEKWEVWLSPIIFFVSLLSFFFLLFYLKSKKIKFFVSSLFTSAFFYWIIASKVLYLHSYYHHFFILTFLVYAGISIYILTLQYKKIVGFIVIIFFLTPVLLSNIKQTKPFLKEQVEKKEINEVSSYLNKNMEEDEFFITGGPIYLTLYSNRKSFNEEFLFLGNEKISSYFKKNIEEIGFVKTFIDNDIVYYVTSGERNFNKKGIYYLFNDSTRNDVSNKTHRTTKILHIENNQGFFENKSEIKSYFEKKIDPYLKLEKKIDNFYIYKFSDPS